MILDDLVGKHQLSGVDFGQDGDANTILFCLDGKVFCATEDPDDGYRSSMAEIKIVQAEISNRFDPVDVMGTMRANEEYGNDVIDFHVIENSQLVLSVGTEASDDYYPNFCTYWAPENLPGNKT